MKHTPRPYKAIDFPPLTEEEKASLERLKNLPDSEIDLSDCPEVSGNGGFYYIQPVKMPKTDVHTKIDNDNLEWLKKPGRGYQTRLNKVIRWARQNNCPIASL